MKTLNELRTALNHDFDIYFFGETIYPVDQDDRKAKFLTTYTYAKVIKKLCADASRRDVESGRTIIPAMKFHVEARVNALGLPTMFFVQAKYGIN